MPIELIVFGDIVEANGKTIRENNMKLGHNIPIGSLVEVKYDEWHGDGACQVVHARLWIVAHSRDCDGSPLYCLSRWKDPEFAMAVKQLKCGFSEDCLTVVEVTPELIRGEGALEQPTPPPFTVEAAIEELLKDDWMLSFSALGNHFVFAHPSGYYKPFIGDTLLAALQAAKEATRG